MKDKKKESIAIIRKRLAKALETAYNEGGDYHGAIMNIRGAGQTFTGRLLVVANGIPHCSTGADAWLDVADTLPEPPTNGWRVKLYYVKVFNK